VRVRQPGHDPCFALEALPAAWITRDLRRQHFDRDEATEPRIASAINSPHPTRADGIQDLERAKTAARAEIGRVRVALGALLEERLGALFEEAFGVLVHGQQRFDLAAKACVAQAVRV
jgi:hypothetical protein